MHIITIKTQNDSDFAPVKEFTERLGLYFNESQAGSDVSEAHQKAAFKNFGQLAGQSNGGPVRGNDLQHL